jgi:hypothetical protein
MRPRRALFLAARRKVEMGVGDHPGTDAAVRENQRGLIHVRRQIARRDRLRGSRQARRYRAMSQPRKCIRNAQQTVIFQNINRNIRDCDTGNYIGH